MENYEFSESITQLLNQWQLGDIGAEAKLFEMLEHELKRICHALLKRNTSPYLTFQTNEVFSELYVRMATQTKGLDWKNRAHFFGIAGRLIRQLLIDNIRQKAAHKRFGFQFAEAFDDAFGFSGKLGNLNELEDALKDLEKLSPERAQLVDLRFFCGMNMDQVAETLGISKATANRRWRWTRAWLWSYLNRSASELKDPERLDFDF